MNVVKRALIDSRPYISNFSRFEKVVESLKLEALSFSEQITALKQYKCEDPQLQTDIHIFIQNVEKLNQSI